MDADLERLVETTDEWIVTRTGIRERRIAGPADSSTSLSLAASREALGRAGVTAADVDRLVGRRAGSDGVGLGSVADAGTFEEFKHAAERAFLLAKLRQHDWNVSETARALDMPRSNLYKKIERYALSREST